MSEQDDQIGYLMASLDRWIRMRVDQQTHAANNPEQQQWDEVEMEEAQENFETALRNLLARP